MILLSHIITVYNKEAYLPDTIASLVGQEFAGEREFIFVDDVSTDRSIEVIRECTRGAANVSVVRNVENRGPSVRLNQGAQLARGKYLHFLDSDDILPKNAAQALVNVLEASGAEMVYGTWQKTDRPGSELLSERVSESPPYTVHDDTLHTVLTGRFKRMCLIATRSLYLRAGGCDEHVFIQDESLPLRLAVHAGRMAATQAVVNLVPCTEGNLSDNRAQLNHDRFFAHYHLLNQHTDITPEDRLLISRKCISAWWKQVRAERGAMGVFSGVFWKYIFSRIWQNLDPHTLMQAALYFKALKNVRRA